MQHVFIILLLGLCNVIARPTTDVQYLTPADYNLLDIALQMNHEIEREIYRRLNEGPMRLRRKVDSVEIPIKRITRIGGNIVMGRKK